MDQIVKGCNILYPLECCQRIVVERNFEKECLKLVVIKSLGYGIIFGSTMVKLPQLIKLLNAKSGIGVSLFSVLLELMALTFGSAKAYASGFPFSAWGESLFLMAMTSLVAYLIIRYDIGHGKSLMFMTLFTVITGILMSGHVPINILNTLQLLAVPLIIFSKLVQAWTNYRNGHTGNLSGLTLILILIGSVTRIATSIQETGDPIMIFSFVLSSTINLLLVIQIFWYWQATDRFIKTTMSKKKN